MTIKRSLAAIEADFLKAKEQAEPLRTRRLVRLMDELESDHGTLRMSRAYTAAEEREPANVLYTAISAARGL